MALNVRLIARSGSGAWRGSRSPRPLIGPLAQLRCREAELGAREVNSPRSPSSSMPCVASTQAVSARWKCWCSDSGIPPPGSLHSSLRATARPLGPWPRLGLSARFRRRMGECRLRCTMPVNPGLTTASSAVRWGEGDDGSTPRTPRPSLSPRIRTPIPGGGGQDVIHA